MKRRLRAARLTEVEQRDAHRPGLVEEDVGARPKQRPKARRGVASGTLPAVTDLGGTLTGVLRT